MYSAANFCISCKCTISFLGQTDISCQELRLCASWRYFTEYVGEGETWASNLFGIQVANRLLGGLHLGSRPGNLSWRNVARQAYSHKTLLFEIYVKYIGYCTLQRGKRCRFKSPVHLRRPELSEPRLTVCLPGSMYPRELQLGWLKLVHRY